MKKTFIVAGALAHLLVSAPAHADLSWSDIWKDIAAQVQKRLCIPPAILAMTNDPAKPVPWYAPIPAPRKTATTPPAPPVGGLEILRVRFR